MKDLGIVENWTCDGVGAWLESKNLGEYSDLLCKDHKVDGRILLSLTEKNLIGPPVKMTVLGDIKRILQAIDDLRYDMSESSCSISSYSGAENGEDIGLRSETAEAEPPGSCKVDRERRPKKNKVYDRLDSFSADEMDAKFIDSRTSISELSRTIISVVYLWGSLLFTSFVMTLAHDRVPDMKTYPPLPDVVLDNIPLIPWAFELCEVCAVCLGAMWVLVLIFHKHRLILMRRMCALSGTIFLLRAFTMYVTALSVPGVHLECRSTVYGTFTQRFTRALQIFFGMGMSLSGVRTCGDYMFSGHTSVVTLLNFLITEYTPRRWYFIHTFCWLLNAFAIFFILAAHEHYTIDVVIAFYISSRLFLYYHTLACAPLVNQSDIERTRIWFPLFWFFENDSKGRIPNEFEFPFTVARIKEFVNGSGSKKKKD